MAGERILVTGGAGFVGSHIVESLVRGGYRVRVFDDFSSGTESNLSAVLGDVEVVRGDILDEDALGVAAEGVDVVSHQAAQLEIISSEADPRADLKTNALGTLNVLRAAVRGGARRFINASSACVYGQAQSTPQSEDSHPTNPNWAYGVSKLAAEKYATIYGLTTELEVMSLRYAIVYGVREWYGRVITMFLSRLLGGEPPVVFGEGDQVRDFVYVGDVARLHELCLESDEAVGQVMNASTGVGTSVKELARICCDTLGTGVEPVFEEIEPGGLSSLMPDRMRLPSELQTMVLDSAKAKKLLGWEPATPLAEGLKLEYDWIGENRGHWDRMHI